MHPDLGERASELNDLIPALIPALTRDNRPPDSRSVITAGTVVNTDVLYTMIMLKKEIPGVTMTASKLCGQSWRRGAGFPECLRAIPRLHDRMIELEHPGLALRLEGCVLRWLRSVKLALGLRTPDMPIGFDCPLHPEREPLVAAGAEGFLQPGPSVYWQHSGMIVCKLCGAQWQADQWPHLGRVLLSA